MPAVRTAGSTPSFVPEQTNSRLRSQQIDIRTERRKMREEAIHQGCDGTDGLVAGDIAKPVTSQDGHVREIHVLSDVAQIANGGLTNMTAKHRRFVPIFHERPGAEAKR